MRKFIWYTLLISKAILIANCVSYGIAIAQEVQGDVEVAEAQYSPESQAIELNLNSLDSMEQVTSVSQLSDVQPTDWAFQALQSLVERYGCIEGYPDRTYRGNRAMTRYEFAAGLNKCLDRIQELISTIKPEVSKEDLDTLRRLQEEFAAELATLRGRVDALEARTTKLEAQQFSTTTKLSGLAIFNITDLWAGDEVKAEGLNPFVARRDPITNRPVVREVDVDDLNTTASYLVWLSLNTSFSGKDSLVIQLVSGNGNSPANQLVSGGNFYTTGVPFLDQTAGITANDVVIREFFYSFPVGNALRVTVGPRINWYRHFDFIPFTLPFTSGVSFNSVNSTFLTSTKRGTGAVIEWNISKQLELHVGYLGENLEFLPGTRPPADPSNGLFNGTNTITAELTFKPSSNANIRLLYQRSNLDRNSAGQIEFEPLLGVADDGFGGRVRDATADTFGVNFNWLITKRFAVFGRYYYASTHVDPVNPAIDDGDINAQNIQAGLAFPNLGKQGALGLLTFVVPFDVLDGREFLVSGSGNGGTQYDIEVSYYLPITDNIAVVPAFYVIRNMNNFDDNPTVFVGNVRTQFNF